MATKKPSGLKMIAMVVLELNDQLDHSQKSCRHKTSSFKMETLFNPNAPSSHYAMTNLIAPTWLLMIPTTIKQFSIISTNLMDSQSPHQISATIFISASASMTFMKIINGKLYLVDGKELNLLSETKINLPKMAWSNAIILPQFSTVWKKMASQSR